MYKRTLFFWYVHIFPGQLSWRTQEVQGTLWRGAISPKSARDNDSGIAVDDVMSPVTVAKEECGENVLFGGDVS